MDPAPKVLARCRAISSVADHGADPVAAAGGQEPDGSGGGHRQLRLVHVRGAEAEARRTVGDHPALQLAVGDGVTDVQTLTAGTHVPVDATYVVAGLVATRLTGLAAVAGHEALVVTVQDPVQAPRDVELQATQDLPRPRRVEMRDRVRGGDADRTVRVAHADRTVRVAHADHALESVPLPYQASPGVCWAGATMGAGTDDRMRTRIASASMPSASAS